MAVSNTFEVLADYAKEVSSPAFGRRRNGHVQSNNQIGIEASPGSGIGLTNRKASRMGCCWCCGSMGWD